MATRSAERRRADGVLYPFPTPVGIAVLLVMGTAFWQSGSSRVAVGFLVALAILMAIDFAISAVSLSRRRVTVEPVRRFAATPGQNASLVGSVDPGGFDMRTAVRRIGQLHDDTDFAMLAPEATGFDLDLAARGQARSTLFLRHRSECSVLGLLWARRYVSQEVAPIHVAPGPNVDIDVPVMADEEITRLREYIPGDRISRISWPTTARTGRLHVRSEEIVDHEVTVVIDLGPRVRVVASPQADQRPPGEQVLELGASVVDDLLGQGKIVTLVTMSLRRAFYEEELQAALESPTLVPRTTLRVTGGANASLTDGPATESVTHPVADTLELIRRLSMAEHAPSIGLPPRPFVLVSPAGVSWER